MSYVMGQLAVGLLMAWLGGFTFGFLMKVLVDILNVIFSNESE